MRLKAAKPISSVAWYPVERLGQLSVTAQLRPWLIGKGVLSVRLKSAHGPRYALRLVDQWSGLLSDAHRTALRTDDAAGLFREVEMLHADRVWVFAQSIMPDSTLSMHPWLAELGDTALDETVLGLSNVERSSYEYAWLELDDALAHRAVRDAEVKPTGLWARRARVALRAAPLLMQEVFLPAMGCA